MKFSEYLDDEIYRLVSDPGENAQPLSADTVEYFKAKLAEQLAKKLVEHMYD